MNTIWTELSCEVPTEMVDELADFLVEISGNGVSVENIELDTFSLDSLEDTPTKTVKAYFVCDASLEEHAEWILMHRERSIDHREGARLG